MHTRLYGVPEWQRAVINVPPEVQLLLSKPVETLVFRFLDPVYSLLRLLTASPLAAVRTNLFFGPEPSTAYRDICHGERLQRIYDALTPGTHALTSILFFDAINRDKKGFNTGDGAIIVGAFFRKYARESSMSKVSLGTFPTLPVAPQNKNKVIYTRFNKIARAYFHKAILMCYNNFNRGPGTVVELQNGEKLSFSKAIIMAIYCDHPAAAKCTHTLMACVQCFTKKDDMDTPPVHMEMRNEENMARKRRLFHIDGQRNIKRAKKMAKAAGVELFLENGWHCRHLIDAEGFTPFGPDYKKDNVYQNMPQVSLHGMDEGLTLKLCVGLLESTIHEASQMPNMNATAVIPTSYINVHLMYIAYTWLIQPMYIIYASAVMCNMYNCTFKCTLCVQCMYRCL